METLETTTKDILSENIEKLKTLFPEAFKEGKIDFDLLKEELGEYAETTEERYNFNWNGKRKARMMAQTPSSGTLRPCQKESVNWETTQNVFIEGDNLEVLKLLQKSYHKKVKMIYIDPPYNTGKDFVYKDNFKDNIKHYKQMTGQLDDEGRDISSNPETSGRYHTDWLNMMYPRLKLARSLLKDDGVIFISIDDHEVHNLRKLCDEIFGEENFVAHVIWEKKYSPQNDAKYFTNNHDFILCVAKQKELWNRILLPRDEKQNKMYKNLDNDPRGPWQSGDLSAARLTPKDVYPITNPQGKVCYPPIGSSWRFSKEKFQELIADNRIWFGKDGTNVPRLKRFRSEVLDGRVPMTILPYKEVGHTQDGAKEVIALLAGAYFTNPKPTTLIDRLLRLTTQEEEIILDFFAGSATTAHAVMKLNAEDGGSRKFIMVQLPEVCDKKSEAFKAGYQTIAEISKERIRRAGKKIQEEHPEYQGDLGFKVFKLDSTNIKPWDVDDDLDQAQLEAFIDPIKPNRTDEDLIFEVLLKYGLDLTVPIKKHLFDGQQVFDIGEGGLIICLSDHISLEVVSKISELKNVERVVFKDSGFESDSVKINAIEMLKTVGIEEVKSI